MVVISVYTYGVKIILKIRWESGFLWGGFHGTPPLCTNGSAGYLMQLSVKLAPAVLLTKFGIPRALFNVFDPRGPRGHRTPYPCKTFVATPYTCY